MKVHIFIDAENIPPEIGFKTVDKFRRDYTIEKVDIIGKTEVLSHRYLSAGKPYRVQNCYYGKNSADTWLCVEIAKTIYEESEIETIIIVSSDRDFLPVIKLATEKQKEIIVVSNGMGHRNLKRLFQELNINADDVKLVDYRDGLNIVENKKRKKKSLSELMKNAQPTFIDTRTKKLRNFYKKMPLSVENFFRKRTEQIKFIFLKCEQNIVEVPFVDGIKTSTFQNILRETNMIGKKISFEKILADSFLKIENDKIYLQTAEEMFPDFEDKENDLFAELSLETLNYFSESLAEIKSVFVKRGSELVEVPFIEGIDAEIFLQLLFEKQLIETLEDFMKIVEESFLEIKDDKVYLRSENEIEDAENFAEFEDWQTVFIKFGGELLEVPFSEGMLVQDFLEILCFFGVMGDRNFIIKVLKDSMLKIREGKLYFADKEKNLSEETFENLNDLSAEVKKFIAANESRFKFINLNYNGYFENIPFVNGMVYSWGAKILLELGVIDKFEDARKVFVNNGFQIINGSIYI